jgi:hypothetical protein
VVAKKQQQVTYQRNKLEARLKQTGVDLATEFPVMEVNTRQQVQGILDGKIVGHRICHIWYDQENQEKTVYFGKIEKVLKRGGGVYVVGYWGEGGSTGYSLPHRLLTGRRGQKTSYSNLLSLCCRSLCLTPQFTQMNSSSLSINHVSQCPTV